jgi:uncharacterized protein
LKYLIWAIVLYVAWRWYLASKGKPANSGADDERRSGDQFRTAASSAPGIAATEMMVSCAHCGIHLPLSEALVGSDKRHYCCDEHRALRATP